MKWLFLTASNALATIFQGYVLTLLWQWFIVTTFTVAPITLVPAIGLMLVVNYFTNQVNLNDSERPNYQVEIAVVHILKPLLFLVAGFIIHLFM